MLARDGIGALGSKSENTVCPPGGVSGRAGVQPAGVRIGLDPMSFWGLLNRKTSAVGSKPKNGYYSKHEWHDERESQAALLVDLLAGPQARRYAHWLIS